jgi:hypothetical protein
MPKGSYIAVAAAGTALYDIFRYRLFFNALLQSYIATHVSGVIGYHIQVLFNTFVLNKINQSQWSK